MIVVLEVKEKLAQTVNREKISAFVSTYEVALKTPVHVYMAVQALDPSRQRLEGGFRKTPWGGNDPLKLDLPEDHYEIPPVDPERTLAVDTYRESILRDLLAALDQAAAHAVLAEINDKIPAELELKADSLFIINRGGRQTPEFVTLARVVLGDLNARPIEVVPATDDAAYTGELGMLLGGYANVAELDALVQRRNLLYLPIRETPCVREFVETLVNHTGLDPELFENADRLIEVIQTHTRRGILAGLCSRKVVVSQTIQEYLASSETLFFEKPVSRIGTTLYSGAPSLRYREIRLMAADPIASIKIGPLGAWRSS